MRRSIPEGVSFYPAKPASQTKIKIDKNPTLGGHYKMLIDDAVDSHQKGETPIHSPTKPPTKGHSSCSITGNLLAPRENPELTEHFGRVVGQIGTMFDGPDKPEVLGWSIEPRPEDLELIGAALRQGRDVVIRDSSNDPSIGLHLDTFLKQFDVHDWRHEGKGKFGNYIASLRTMLNEYINGRNSGHTEKPRVFGPLTNEEFDLLHGDNQLMARLHTTRSKKEAERVLICEPAVPSRAEFNSVVTEHLENLGVRALELVRNLGEPREVKKPANEWPCGGVTKMWTAEGLLWDQAGGNRPIRPEQVAHAALVMEKLLATPYCPSFIWVEGPSQIGKTTMTARLVHAASHDLRMAGHLVDLLTVNADSPTLKREGRDEIIRQRGSYTTHNVPTLAIQDDVDGGGLSRKGVDTTRETLERLRSLHPGVFECKWTIMPPVVTVVNTTNRPLDPRQFAEIPREFAYRDAWNTFNCVHSPGGLWHIKLPGKAYD
jgi:hypothetical protein